MSFSILIISSFLLSLSSSIPISTSSCELYKEKLDIPGLRKICSVYPHRWYFIPVSIYLLISISLFLTCKIRVKFCRLTYMSNSFVTPWTLAHISPVHGEFPGKNTGVGCHFLPQGIFPTQKSSPDLLLGRQIFFSYHWTTWEVPYICVLLYIYMCIYMFTCMCEKNCKGCMGKLHVFFVLLKKFDEVLLILFTWLLWLWPQIAWS